ncbi:MAG: replication endonuclease [Acidiferrobacter sp.]
MSTAPAWVSLKGSSRRWAHAVRAWQPIGDGSLAVAADDARFWSQAFNELPPQYTAAANTVYRMVGARHGRRAANEAMATLREAIAAACTHRVRLDIDDEDLCDLADRTASRCWRHRGEEAAIARRIGIEPVRSRPRMVDPLWWRRRLRRAVGRDSENVARLVGLVYRRAGCYASDVAVSRTRAAADRNDRILGGLDLVDGTTRLPLDQVVDGSVANPRVRRCEVMTRIGGTEDWAAAQGWRALFVTITCPAGYHARDEWGRPYPHNGATPRDAQAYLCRMWARIRAAWRRADLYPAGIRVAEPHHDGTPHWHLLVFAPAAALEEIEAIMWYHALYEAGTEPGVGAHRFKTVRIDRRRGRAASYVAKYIAKGLDGVGLDHDRKGNDGATAATRIRAWASTWGIRQFQFFGTAPVGPWRELRRIGGAPAGPLGDAWHAADWGLWAEYLRIMAATPVALAHAWSDRPNRYGEPHGDLVVGVEYAGVRLPTRRAWRIEKRPSSSAIIAPAAPSGPLGNMSITVRHNIVGINEHKTTTGSINQNSETQRWHAPAAAKPP